MGREEEAAAEALAQELRAEEAAAEDVESAAQRRADTSRLPALCLFGRPTVPSTPSPSADDIVGLLQCCQIADDDAVVLTAVCARLRARLPAAGVSFFASDRDEAVCIAGDGTRVEPSSAARVKTANALVLPQRGAERNEAGVPVRYAGQVVGWLVAVWSLAGTWQDGDVALLLSTGATAAAPALVGLMARKAGQRATRGSELLGVSQAIEAVRIAVEKSASAPFAVLVEGESGSGKELVARLLHKLGPRRDRPFITLNCAALPDDLVESELFGHARGAFTGAVGERRGVFEEAHTGTLFLDEIGELSARAQAKLLRVIQEGEIRRVGREHVPSCRCALDHGDQSRPSRRGRVGPLPPRLVLPPGRGSHRVTSVARTPRRHRRARRTLLARSDRTRWQPRHVVASHTGRADSA